MPALPTFSPSLLAFLDELAGNNNRPWFLANKHRYEEEVFQPCQAFIRAFAPRLKKISPYFVASDRRIGGSLMRVYRDTRFHNLEPYKMNVGIQFRHEMGRDVHAPAFYIHIAPDECFLALGVWRPEPEPLAQIRGAIVARPIGWRRACGGAFARFFQRDGSQLKRIPRGFDSADPIAEELKWTDYLGLQELSEQQVLARGFVDRVEAAFAAGRPFMRFLCEAMEVPF